MAKDYETQVVDPTEHKIMKKSLPAILDEMDGNIAAAMEAARRAEAASKTAKEAASVAESAAEAVAVAVLAPEAEAPMQMLIALCSDSAQTYSVFTRPSATYSENVSTMIV